MELDPGTQQTDHSAADAWADAWQMKAHTRSRLGKEKKIRKNSQRISWNFEDFKAQELGLIALHFQTLSNYLFMPSQPLPTSLTSLGVWWPGDTTWQDNLQSPQHLLIHCSFLHVWCIFHPKPAEVTRFFIANKQTSSDHRAPLPPPKKPRPHYSHILAQEGSRYSISVSLLVGISFTISTDFLPPWAGQCA